MSDATEFRKLAARVYVQQLALAELCRLTLDSGDIAKLFVPLDKAVVAAEGDQELAEALNEALAAFRLSIMKPRMGV